MKINQLDLFSGIGGFHLGFKRAGYEVTSYFSEIDQHAIAVYKHQFPTSTYVGSVTNVRGADLPRIDLITFGSPCQDFSLAGKRLGMEGERSSLILQAIRLISECRPSVFVWENVKGTFSSNDGADFWAIIQAFTNIGGYRLEWQLLNTSWFLPQNRERIYLVGYSTTTGGDWRGVFPIAANGRKALEPSIKQIGTKLDSNSGTQPYQQDRVYDADGIVPALNKGKSDLILRVKSATSQGYEEATIGDSIYTSRTESKTRRGRVGKQKAQTLETSCNQAVVEGYRIRRLTPIECERLQGFPDNHTAFGNYDGVVKPMSNTQRYKQCGNAVTVDVVSAVAKNCLPLFKTNQQ
jgi:DNA (cytosine-5)-methyltransferase 1